MDSFNDIRSPSYRSNGRRAPSSFDAALTSAVMGCIAPIIFLVKPGLVRTQNATLVISQLLALHKCTDIDQSQIPVIRILSRPSEPVVVQVRKFWSAAIDAVERIGGDQQTTCSDSIAGVMDELPIAVARFHFQILAAVKDVSFVVIDDTVMLEGDWLGKELERLCVTGIKAVLIGSSQFQRSMCRDSQIARSSALFKIHPPRGNATEL